MVKKLNLDNDELDIEKNYAKLKDITNKNEEITKIVKAAKSHMQRKKLVTLRLNEMDLEAIKIKASKKGLPYQTYLNMIIHQDATSL